MKLVSIVIPVYNEQKSLEPLYTGIKEHTKDLPYEFHILFVNDGSTDGSWDTITELAEKDPRVQGISFSRNFGKEMALTAGLVNAKGDAVMTMDSDMQQPPALIPEFLAKWASGGVEIVIGIRKKVERQNMLRRWGSIIFYELMAKISDVPFIPQSTDFRLLDRKVVEAFKEFGESNRITRGLIDWLGFNRDFVYFDEQRRAHGNATYSTLKLIHLAVISILSHSLFPLKAAGYLGVLVFLGFGSFGFFMTLVKFHVITGFAFSGPAQIGVLNGFLIGIVLMSLGVIALYIGNVHQEIARRPLYIIRDTKNV